MRKRFFTGIDPEALLTGPEVDRILNIPPTTRWRLTKAGKLRARRPTGKHPRYLGKDVLALRDSTLNENDYAERVLKARGE